MISQDQHFVAMKNFFNVLKNVLLFVEMLLTIHMNLENVLVDVIVPVEKIIVKKLAWWKR